MKVHIRMKKYLAIGFSILSLLLFLNSPSDVKAQDPTPEETATPTLIIEPFDSTPTPIILGNCPVTGCVVDNGDLSLNWILQCGDYCLCTKTPSFPTSTPEGFIPTPTITPTALSELNINKVKLLLKNTAGTIIDPVIFGTEYTANDYATFNYYTYPSPSFEVRSKKYHGKYTVGLTSVVEAILVNHSSFNEKLTFSMHNYTTQPITVRSYGAGSDVWTETIPASGDLSKTLVEFTNGGTVSETLNLDITVPLSGTVDSLDFNFKYSFNGAGSGSDINNILFKFNDGGITYTPRVEGYCSVPEGKIDDSDLLSLPRGYWVGQSSCISLDFLVDFLNNESIQDFLDGFSSAELGDLPSLTVCFRQFFYTELKILGISIDIQAFLYTIAGIWAVKNLIGLVR